MKSASRLLAGQGQPGLLIIDDEPQVRDFLKTAFDEEGFRVSVAGNGEQAIEKARRESFDIAICDLKMPGIDGIETLTRLREIDPDLQVIILTAHGSLERAIEGLRAGVFDFLQKPVVLKDLMFSVERALERRDLVQRVALFDLSRSIFATLRPEELYERILKAAIGLLRADDASLMLLDRNRDLILVRSTSLGEEILAETRQAIGERIAGRVALQPEAVLIRDDVALDARFPGVRSMRPVNTAILCPLMMRDELLGVLNVNRVRIETLFSERDRQSATVLGSLAALALGNARLHHELQTRLQQLSDTQEEVIQNEKMVALGSLLSGVAHELNNPLCAMLGYAQLLQGGELDARLRKGVDVILREGERASRIVADLLRFARREKPERRRLGLSGVLLRTIERKSYELKTSRIEVVTDLSPDLPMILGDFQQLQLAFTHLITNAQEAMFRHRGEGRLTIKGEHRSGRLILTFADDGPGIPVENARRVFDPFFTTKGVGKGTGLGLSVCFAIVRDHGGVLRVNGRPGHGAVFTLELPVAPAETVAAADPRPAGEIAAATDDAVPRPSGPRVLIADPTPDVQNVLVDILERLGYQVDTADRGETARIKIRSQSYEALIADFDLPELDGRRLLEMLSSERPRLARRVIFLADDAARPQMVEVATTSGNMLMAKPFRLDAMRDALRRLFPAAPGGASPSDAAPAH